MREFVVRLPTSSVVTPVRLDSTARPGSLTVAGGDTADDEVAAGLSLATAGGSAERRRGVRDHRGSRRPLLLLHHQWDLAVVKVSSY